MRLMSLFLFSLFWTSGLASHLIGGNITYECVGGNDYKIVLTLYEHCSSGTVTTADQVIQVANDCGTSSNTTLPLQNTIFQQQGTLPYCGIGLSTCQGGNYFGYYEHQWSAVVNLPPCNSWHFEYSSCCRTGTTNADVTAADLQFETVLNNALGGCDNSPVVQGVDLPIVSVNDSFCVDLMINDIDGDSLVYSWVTPSTGNGQIAYNTGYSSASPLVNATLDSQTGVICGNVPVIGNYLLVLKVESFNQNGDYLGEIVHDFWIIVMNLDYPEVDAMSSENYVGVGDTVVFTASGVNVNSYSWDFGDGTLGLGALSSHTFQSAGSYVVYLTGTNGSCSEMDSLLIEVGYSGVNDEEVQEIIVFNVFDDLLIEYRGLETYPDHVRLYDLKGQRIYSSGVVLNEGMKQSIDVSYLTDGVYIIELSSTKEGVVFTRKILLQRNN